MRRIIAFFLTVLVAAGLGLGAGYVVLRGEEAVPVKAAPQPSRWRREAWAVA